MMRVLLNCGVLIALALGSPAASRTTSGTWTAHLHESGYDRLQLSMRGDGDGNMGMGFERSSFTGLDGVDLESATRVPVRFEMRREAGTLTFEGTFRAGRGTGEYSFASNPDFPKMLERLGVAFEAERGEEDRELMTLAMFDVSTTFIRSMQVVGYKVPLDKYVAFRIFKIDPGYVGEMSALGFGKLSADDLVTTKVHNVSPEYIRKMRASGKDLTLEQLVQSRIFEVTPEFAAEMGRIGYPDLDQETLVQFKIHGVSAEFIQDIRRLGYARVPADQLVAMRIHGVTPEFIRRVEKAGYHEVPIEKLVQMRIFDIDPEMVGALDDDHD